MRADRGYLVTGGLGGLGLATAQKLVDLGARHLTLVSRSARPTPEAARVLAALAQRAQVEVVSADVSRPEDVGQLVRRPGRGPVPAGRDRARGRVLRQDPGRGPDLGADRRAAGRQGLGGWLLHEAAAELPAAGFFTSTPRSPRCWAAPPRATTRPRRCAGRSGRLAARQGLPAPRLTGRPGPGRHVRPAETPSRRRSMRSGVRFFSPTRALQTLVRLSHPPRTRVVGQLTGRRGRRVSTRLRRLAPARWGAGAAGRAARSRRWRAARAAERLCARCGTGGPGAAPDARTRTGPTPGSVSLGLDSLMALDVKTGLEARSGCRCPPR